MDLILKKRIWFLTGVILFLFFAAIVKALFVQVINRDELVAYQKNQIYRSEILYPNRGLILDRGGNPLALNIRTYNLYTIPRNLESRREFTRSLKKYLTQLDWVDLEKQIRERDRFTYIARNIDLTKETIENLKTIPGLYLDEVSRRFYPNQDLAGQILGFVGVDNKGLGGIEFQFDEHLRGSPEKITYLKDARGIPVRFKKYTDILPANDIILSIDKNIQAVAERALKKAVIESKSLSGGIGVMDSRTGEVLAMANYPSFDPNYLDSKTLSHRKLSFISDPMEPGSVFKAFTIASALEHQILNEETSYYCEKGQFRVQNHTITEADSYTKNEWLTVSEILSKSSNIGTTKIAFDLTYPKLKTTLEKLNIGLKTDIELPGESRGIFADQQNVTPLRLSNLSFGQGIAMTGIQVLSAYLPFTNGGYWIRPTILKVDDENKVEKIKIFDNSNVETVQGMLYKAVEEGTGVKAKMDLFKFAGKTSTAQRPSSNGGYEGYVAGFIGFPLDVEQPFVVYVYLDNPQDEKPHGGKLAAPVAKEVAEFILLHHKEKVNQVRQKIANTFIQDRVYLATSAPLKEGMTPNFINMDRRSAKNVAEKYGIKLVMRGYGIVKAQKPNFQEKLNERNIVYLDFEPPTHE